MRERPTKVAVCVKCGGIADGFRYVSGTLFMGGRGGLLRTCGDCGYSWTEPTRDAEATPERG